MSSEPSVVFEWLTAEIVAAYNSDLPHVRALGRTEDEALRHLEGWYADNQPSIFHGLPVADFWWSFTGNPYHVFIAEHMYEALYDEIVETFQSLHGDLPDEVSAWSPEIQYVFPLSMFTVEK